MTIQLMDLNKWQKIENGELVRFHREMPRVVRVDVNCPDTCRIYVAQTVDGIQQDAQFLAVVYGRDRIEFAVDGPFDLYADGAPLSFYTVDGADWSMQPVDDTSYTRIVEKRVVNPEVAYMMELMYHNMERRLAEQSVEIERNVTARYAANARDIREQQSAAQQSDNKGKTADTGGKASDKPKAPDGGGTPDKPATQAEGANVSGGDKKS